MLEVADLGYFLKDQLSVLNVQVDLLKKRLDEGDMSPADRKVITDATESLRNMLTASNSTADASALSHVCENISSQLKCLESLVLYQA